MTASAATIITWNRPAADSGGCLVIKTPFARRFPTAPGPPGRAQANPGSAAETARP
jgi:hypothetical protein